MRFDVFLFSGREETMIVSLARIEKKLEKIMTIQTETQALIQSIQTNVAAIVAKIDALKASGATPAEIAAALQPLADSVAAIASAP